MPVTFNQLIRNAALRVNALIGPQASGLEVNYVISPLTSAQFKSADFPFTAFKDAALMAEEAFAQAIAANKDSQYRSFIGSVTASLVSGALLPHLDVSGNPIIGVRGAIVDQADSVTPLTEKPLALVRRVKAETWRLYTPYYYAIERDQLFHTRSLVLIRVCTYNRQLRQTAIDASLNSFTLMPDALEPDMVAFMVSMLVKDGVYADQGGLYGARAMVKLNELRGIAA